GVTTSAGPYPETTVSVSAQVTPSIPVAGGHAGKGTSFTIYQSLTLVGRSSAGGPVDDLTLTSGHWPTGPGQIVLSTAARLQLGLGAQVTVARVAGSPKPTGVAM